MLLRTIRAFNGRASEKLRKREYHKLSQAHIGLLPQLDEEGTRITTLPERAGMTKQGMGHLVVDLEQQGIVARTLDSADRRATLVSFTEAGRRDLAQAVEVTGQLEAEVASKLGEQRLVTLRDILAEPERDDQL